MSAIPVDFTSIFTNWGLVLYERDRSSVFTSCFIIGIGVEAWLPAPSPHKADRTAVGQPPSVANHLSFSVFLLKQ